MLLEAPPAPDRARSGGLRARQAWVLLPPAAAAALVCLGLLLGWRGVDWPAALYREGLFRTEGFVLWDSQWYSGHWLPDYSVIFPAVAAGIGTPALAVLGASCSALAFDRLIVPAFPGKAGRAASLTFALSTIVETSIGQLPFLLGEAFGLLACWALARRRWWPAAALALLSALASPLAGAFLALAATAWGLSRWPRHRLAAATTALLAVMPTLVTAVLFPGEGPMPYPLEDWLWELAVAAGLFVLALHADRALKLGIALFAVAATLSFLVASPLGGNVGRIEDVACLPVAVALCWPRRKLLMVAVGIPLMLSQWGPAWGAMTSDGAQPAAQRSFYTPLLAELHHLGGPPGRLEVVPTYWHWEADYLAPYVPLARGWERQVDEARNPIFYKPGALSPASYRAWLLDDGVTFVALPHALLDFSGTAEAHLLQAGVPGLRLVWSDPDWRLYKVEGSEGIVSPPGHLLEEGGDEVLLRVSRPGKVLVRVHWEPGWRVADGSGCLERSPGDWISLTARRAGRLRLHLGLGLTSGRACRS